MNSVTEQLWSYFQVYRHVLNQELGRGVFRNVPIDNVDLREKFITSQITKESFMSTLHQRSNLHKKHLNLYNILQTWINVVAEHLRIFTNETLSTTNQILPNEHLATKRLEQLKSITKFTNEQFDRINAKYTFAVLSEKTIVWRLTSQPKGVCRFRPSTFRR